MSKQDVFVIGGGAAGIMAAITAARNHAKVTILEHTDRIGKKILATGNGRCNLTNLLQKENCYRSNNSKFPMQIISQFDEKKVLQFFQEIGVYTKSKNGYIYPYSEQASVVLDLLILELKRLNITICHEVSIKEIIRKNNKIQIITEKDTYTCDSVILATGSKASPKTGSDGSGYILAKKLGHHIIKPLPALVQLRSNEEFFKSIAGVRCEAELTLKVDKKVCAKDQGELQLTDYGISGIPTFQISRYAVRAIDEKKKVEVLIDFIPAINKNELLGFIEQQIAFNPNKKMEDILTGLLNKKLVPVLIKKSGISNKLVGKDLKEKQLDDLVCIIKSFQVTIDSYNSFEQGQVCSGGVDTNEVSSKTLESTRMKGIYFAGELLDVDGICGGYNLQWAWSSGYVAGWNASRK